MSRLLPLLAALGAAGLAQANPQGFYRQPAVQGDTVVFVSQGDLWRSSLAGGAAQRISSHAGQEISPVLLPDGKTLAFVAQYESAGDVYTLSLDGGVPQRRTWLGAASVRVWGHDGKDGLLITAPAEDGRPHPQPYLLKGGQLRALPVGDASDAAFSLDGKRLVFTRNGLRGDNAKNYRGGAIASLWVMELGGSAEARPLLGADFPRANNRRPMPYRDAQGRERIAFLSDRDGFFNVWSVAADGSDARQHTRFKDFDARQASISGSTVVLARGADLQRVDLSAAGAEAPVLSITLAGDQPASTARWIQKPQNFLADVAVAPNGERAVIGVRGRLATQGTQALRRAVLQMPEGARCREAAFSSDSQSVFALCDMSGEVELWQFDALGLSAPKQITRGAPSLRTDLSVAPDGRHLVHADLAGAVYLTDLKAEGGPATRQIDQLPDNEGIEFAWHPDAQALAYVRRPADGGARSQVWLYTLADGDKRALTSAKYHSSAPAFSPDGQWLYFASRRHFQLQQGSSVWAERNMGPAFEPGTKLYALALQSGLRSPFAAKDELPPPLKAEVKKDDKAAAKPDEKKEEKKDAKPALPRIERAGLAERVHELPAPAGRYRGLQAEAKRLWWIESDFGAGALKSLSLEPGANPDTHSDKVRQFQLSGNGKTLLVQRDAAPGQPTELLLLDAAPKPPADTGKFAVRWADWQIAVNPRQEWQQMFADAWRMQRDFFYDAQMHGIDWQASRARHAALLPRVGDRVELGELMGMMASDLSLLHSQVGYGDLPPLAEEAARGRPGRPPGAARKGRAHRAHLPQRGRAGERARAAAAAGAGAARGRGHHRHQRPTFALAAGGDPAGRPGRQAAAPGGAGRRRQRGAQRDRDAGGPAPRHGAALPGLALQPRRGGDQALGRPHRLPAPARHGRAGHRRLRARVLRPAGQGGDRAGRALQQRRQHRFLGAGQAAAQELGLLAAAPPAGGPRFANMQQSYAGKLAMLINENTYSDGETVAEGFKRLGLGPVIGKTTSGAGVWLSDRNRLVDNGILRAAEMAQMSPDGQVLIEGKGVVPDLEVENPPRATAQGQDAQLEAAVQQLLKQLPARAPAADERLPRVKAYPRPRG
ncbi:MAG: S41 family peptidase [Inhella sp.]